MSLDMYDESKSPCVAWKITGQAKSITEKVSMKRNWHEVNIGTNKWAPLELNFPELVAS
jgi:hypothetical protein